MLGKIMLLLTNWYHLIVFPPLQIKLGLMKQIVKALDKDGDCFQYICQSFPSLSNEKLKAGIFDSRQIPDSTVDGRSKIL